MKPLFYLLFSLMIPLSGLADSNQASREVLLDNDAVQVVRLTYPPGTESGMHGHDFPHRVVYFIRGGTLELVPEDPQEASQVLIVADGESVFLPAVTHNVRNIGKEEIVIVETEIK
jgi:mannose-6-phosphate isomerase-like protein (cupin superfamily)